MSASNPISTISTTPPRISAEGMVAAGVLTHVLIVEDHEENRNLLRVLLGANGYRVTAAGDGVAALDAARRDPPDAVVSDVQMPKLDGFALCRAWMQDPELKGIPFIFYSATNVRPQDEEFAAALGAARYLIRPLESEVFLAELRAVLQRWSGHSAPTSAPPLDDVIFHPLHELALARKIEDKIAQLEETNRKLRESEERFRSLTEVSSDFYWESDAEHRITHRTAGRASGAPSVIWRGAQIDKCPWDVPYLSPDEAGWQAHRAVLDAHFPFRNFELSRAYADGTEHFESIGGNPVFDASGAFKGYRGVGSDITERKRGEEALRRFGVAMDTVADAIYLVDRSTMRFIHVNDAACRMQSKSREELLALGPDGVLSTSRAELERTYDAIIASGVDAEPLEMLRPRKDGSAAWIELRRHAQRSGGCWTIVTLVRDITERKVAEAKIQRLTQLYAALSQCNEAIVRCASEEELFPQVCRAAVQFGGMQMAWIGIVDPNTRMVRPAAGVGDRAEEYMRDIKISVDADSPMGQGTAGTALRENQPVWCQDFQNDPLVPQWRHERRAHFGWRASAALPLHRNGVPVGALNLYAGEVGAFDEPARRLLVEMATDISFALDNFARETARNNAEEALRASKHLLELTFACLDEAVMVIDPDTRTIIACNPAVERIFGYTEQDITGRNSEFLYMDRTWYERFGRELFPALDAYGKFHTEFQMRRKDGSVFPTENTVTEIRGASGRRTGVVSVVRDISERKQAGEALRAAEEQFRGLVEQSIAGTYIVQDGKFVYVNPRYAEIFGYGSTDELIGRDFLSLVAEKDRDIAAGNIRRRIEGEIDKIKYEFTGLRKDGSMVSIGVHGARATHLGRPAVIGLLDDISEKKRAEDDIKRYVAQLETAFMSTVEVATTLGEMRDPYTAGHQRRVGKIAVAIGAELGFDERRQEGLRVAGYLHDIGKITVPAEILSKPAKLSPIEFTLIQGHAQAGFDVLKNVKFPWPVAEVALQHHERMDGSGYPQGLKGEAIMLESRIMAVADVIEAMSSHRPYRPGLGIEAALAEIERGRESAYDSDVVGACLKVFREKGYVT